MMINKSFFLGGFDPRGNDSFLLFEYIWGKGMTIFSWNLMSYSKKYLKSSTEPISIFLEK